MQVSIEETAIIRPLEPPFHHIHILSLSHLDTDRNLLLTLRYLRIYSNNSHHQHDPFTVLSKALSAALVRYYPFAGTLLPRHSDNRLQLHCVVGDGVPLIHAAVNCTMDLESHVDEKFADQLVPESDPTRPISLQITQFKCGGFVLGAAVHHAICDGLGASLFFNAMAELARGSSVTTIDPVWERSDWLGPRKPPRVEFPIGKYLRLEGDFRVRDYEGRGKGVVKEWVNVKEEWLNRLKGLLRKQSGGMNFTTFEALCGFIWRARIKAKKEIHEDEIVTFAYSINIRKVVKPPVPDGYYGNGCVPMLVHLTVKELAEQPIWETAVCIKKSKSSATSEYVASFIDFQELHYKEGISLGRRVSGFTDWRHLGHSEVDFGWGSPDCVLPVSSQLLGSAEPCFLLPAKEGVKVLVHLEEDDLLAFRHEMAKLENGSA